MRSEIGLVVLGLTLFGQPVWAASPCDYFFGVETLAQGCDGVAFEGCCLPNGDLVWCEKGYLCLLRCSTSLLTCGWNAWGGFYDCGETGSDPSGQHPKDCPACQPDCTGKKCGNGGCVLMPYACGKCTECGKTCVSGFCVFTACEGKECGPDGCGGECGTCPAGDVCVDGKCCTTDCAGKTCGPDGCGGKCGECAEGFYCDETQNCQPCSCGDKECGTDQCGHWCGTCSEGYYCDVTGYCRLCACEGKNCGHDGCGEPCGTCPAGQACLVSVGTCTTDVPYECQVHDTPGCPGCGCEACVCQLYSWCCSPSWYWDEYCVMKCENDCGGPACHEYCFPSCKDKVCGYDECGGTCGFCPAGTYCGAGGKACIPCTCKGKQCGEDGCGKSCGTCSENEFCNEQGQCVGYYPESCLGPYEPSAPSCPAGLTYVGCCDGSGRVLWCGSGKLYCVDCVADNTTCGWFAEDGYYDCGQTGADPSGLNPYECVFGPCEPDCTGKMCGNGGCPGAADLCGTCPEGLVCKDGICLKPGCQEITFEGCCENSVVKWCENDEIHSIDCSKDQPPNNVCGWKADAGFYDCGGTGEDPSGKNPIECPSICTPSCVGQECGNGGCADYPDVLCGTCPTGKTCVNGKCVAGCEPNCTDKECGDDGCGGQCPPGCGSGQVCINGKCCTPNCLGKECGDDGCGGSCGACGAGGQCVNGKCELVTVGDVGPADASPTTETGGGKKGGGGAGCTTGLNQTMWPLPLLLAAMAAIVGTRRKP